MEDRQQTTKEIVVGNLQAAVQSLALAHTVAIKAQPLAQDLPVFQKILGIQKDISAMMLEVHKLRGL